MKEIKSPYKELAFAICMRAVDDYRDIRYFFAHTEIDDGSPAYLKERQALFKKELPRIESFFNSELFEIYSGLQGSRVYKKLKDECDHGYYGDHRRYTQV